VGDEERVMYTERVQLPSRGQFYGGKLPEGWVEIRPLKTSEEAMLASPERDRMEKMNLLIERCLLTKEVPLSEMLVADRMFLLLSIRNVTYGPEYRFTIQCPDRTCQGSVPVELVVPQGLQMRILTPEDKEPFSVKLPRSGKTVGLRLPRVKDEAEALEFANKDRSGRTAGEVTYLFRLAVHIVSIDDKGVNRLQALDFVDDMEGADSLVMRRTIEEHDCGVDILVERKCNRCGVSFQQLMPFTDEFFRPRVISSRPGQSSSSSKEGPFAGKPSASNSK